MHPWCTNSPPELPRRRERRICLSERACYRPFHEQARTKRTHSEDFAAHGDRAVRNHEKPGGQKSKGGRTMRHHTRSWHTDFTTADFEHPDHDR
jgi:hypothetical protein